MTIEVLSNWYLYGPQIYLSLRLAYDPTLDAAKLMDDYYEKFYGPAAKAMKKYWQTIDEATAKLHNHSGGFYGLASAFTREVFETCFAAIAEASREAIGNPNDSYSDRVAMHAHGLKNVLDYMAICQEMAQGDFAAAKKTYDTMVTRIGELVAKRQANPEYGTAYLKRFLLKTIEGGLIATTRTSS
jgi:hypothetical protein